MQQHRSDIDGLRGIAIGAVVLYHLGVSGFSGGLAGVDVFFVISGFLITRILRAELQAGSFSVAAFYERRVRRIFPALFMMLVASAVLAWLIEPPPEALRFGHSLAASALFLSNFFFLVTGAGYFTPLAQDAPLLHLWSLAVEEQFYLLFPWLLLAGWSWWRRSQAWWLAALAILSLGLAWALGRYSASAVFYFAGSRLWELLIGALLVFVPSGIVSKRWISDACGTAGMALVALAISGHTADWWATGLDALVPCLGAALLVATGGAGVVAALLSFRPLVFVGLISYSLYLWHWPLLVFWRTGRPLETGGEGWVVLVAFGLAAASWRFVEQPLRRAVASRRRVFALAIGAVVAALAVAALFSLTRGGSSRYSPHVQWLFSFDGYQAKEALREGRCLVAPRRMNPGRLDSETCLAAVPGKRDYLLVGDSHAAHLWSGLAHAMPEINVQQATASGCRPLLYGARDARCEKFLDEVLLGEVASRKPAAVILAGRWSQTDIEPLHQTVGALLRTGVQVFVIGPGVEYRLPLPHVLALAEHRQDGSLVDRARVGGIAELDRLMAARLADSGARYISLYRALCPADGPGCVTVTPQEGIPVQFDYGHLTVPGSRYVGWQLRAALLMR